MAEYEVLDVTVLPDLQDALLEDLTDAGKTEMGRQEFEHQIRPRPSGILRSAGGAQAVRAA